MGIQPAIRPAIRPGAALLRRDRDHLQVGTSPGYVIRDQAGLLAVLRLLDGMRRLPILTAVVERDIPEFTGDVGAVVDELLGAGVVCDARQWDYAGRPALSDEARFHCATGLPMGPLQRRNSYRVALIDGTGTQALSQIVTRILTDSSISTTTATDANLLVVFSLGEPARATFAAAGRHGIDHLPVVIDEERIRIGPLVEPGRTPCVHCYDLYRTDWDRAWPALSHQFGRPDHSIPTPAAVCATTLYAAAVDVAADIVAHCDGRDLKASGRLMAIGPGHTERTTWPVSFHPACGCSLLHVA